MIIHNAHGKVTIPDHVIDLLEPVMGPVNLFLRGKALGDVGKQIFEGLSNYQRGDIVQIIDNFRFKNSGVYDIVKWELSSKDTLYEFDLSFKHK